MATPISVFIVNFNTSGLLEKCLESLINNKNGLDLKICVADNASTDGSPEMVRERFPQVCLTRYVANLGFAKAINPMLSSAEGKYCLLLHPDIEILPYTLSEFVKFFETHPGAGILGGNLYYSDGTPNPCEVLFPGFWNDFLRLVFRFFARCLGISASARNVLGVHWSHEATRQVDGVWNACMMVRREIFDRLGLFDERFFVWYSDWDLCKRAADAGWSIYYLKPAVAIHHERRSLAKDIAMEEVRYKVDGWCSVVDQIRDRYMFLRKHASSAATFGVKAINVAENLLRVGPMLASLVLEKAGSQKVSTQLTVTRQSLQTILKA